MGLKRVLDTIDGVDAGLAKLYVKSDDGKYRLDVEGDDDALVVLKGVVSKERSLRESAEKRVAAFKGLDPDVVRETLQRWDAVKDIDPTKEADKLAEQKVKAREAQLVAKHTSDITARDERIAFYKKAVEQSLIRDKAAMAIAEAKGSVKLLMPHVEARTRVKEVDGGRFVVEVLDDDGNPRIKDAKGSMMGVDDLIAEMRGASEFAGAFAGTGNSGGGAKGGGSLPGSGPSKIGRDQAGTVSIEKIASGEVTVGD